MKKSIIKVFVVLALALSMLGCTVSVFAAGRDLVGNGTGAQSGQSSTNVSAPASGSQSNTGTQNTAPSGGTGTVSQQTEQSAPAQQVTTTTVTAAQTADLHDMLPFIGALAGAALVFWICLLFLLSQVRQEKAEIARARRIEIMNSRR